MKPSSSRIQVTSTGLCAGDNAERAEGVRRCLNEGYRRPMTQMHVASYGEERPVASNNTDEGRYRNRRVDLVLMDARPR